jgi:hypothetical protein
MADDFSLLMSCHGGEDFLILMQLSTVGFAINLFDELGIIW